MAAVGLTGVTGVSLARNSTCAFAAAEGGWCWGSNVAGMLGTGAAPARSSSVPVAVEEVGPLAGLVTGEAHACAWTQTGEAWCWGGDLFGCLGQGTVARSAVPLRVGSLSGVVELAAGDYRTCARLDDGTLHCWGYAERGALGHRDLPLCAAGTSVARECSATPLRVPGLTDVTSVALTGTARAWGCATASGGRVSCWGHDYSVMPVSVDLPPRAWRLTAGKSVVCAHAEAGPVHCWSALETPSPFLPSGDYRAITVGGDSRPVVCGVLRDGTTRCGGGCAEGVEVRLVD